MFNIHPHVDGGHVLLSPYWFTQKTVAVAGDGKRLIRSDGAGAVWDFVRVGDKCH